MKLVYVHGSMPYFENEDSFIRGKIRGVFLELEADVEEVDLGRIHPPFFEGETTRSVDGIVEKLRAADGVIFSARTNLYAPSAVLMNFLEYLNLPEYKGALAKKHIMLVLFSKNGGEKSALNLLNVLVSHLGGFAVCQIGLQSAHLDEANEQSSEFIGKVCEDFYRVVRQKRNYIIPQDFEGEPNFVADPLLNTAMPKPPIKESFTHEEEQDIEELSRLFSKKFGGPDDAIQTKLTHTNQASKLSSAVRKELKEETPTITPPTALPAARAKTAKQITQSLPHYFQPQLSAGLRAVIQINVFGEEEFTGHLYIHSTECTYTDGPAPAPDIVIMADSNMWLEVLGGKFTAQKAFMVGGLKVRGDFVLLSKFDNLFQL